MMKLPDFLLYEPMNRLRSVMGAVLGDFTPAINPDRLTVQEIEQLSRSGIDVPLDQVRVLLDGTLGYKDQRVILYIRDIQQYHASQLPKFHVSDCSKIQEMRKNDRFGRYVVATRDDGKFDLNLTAKWHGGTRKITEKLDVCRLCLTKVKWNGFNRMNEMSKRSTVDNFKLTDFFKIYGKSLVSSPPKYNDKTAPLNEYSAEFKVVSEELKRKRFYRCDECGIDLSQTPKFLHAHHRNALKYDNSAENISVVCIRCHAEEHSHSHMKSLPEYHEFLSLPFVRRWSMR